MHDTIETSSWKRFWERGGWWRSLLLVVAYFVLYQAGSLLFLPLLAHVEDPAATVLVGTALPIALGSLLLIVFAWSNGWLSQLFGRQPIYGRAWMWIAVAVVLVFNLLRFATIDYGAAGLGVVLAWILTGVFIGFAEELLTRGLVVNLMRNAGYREIVVALVSAALFAGLHLGNVLSGQSLVATAFQVLYTFAFGLCMYLALRCTGNLLWPILLHATTDPSIFLQTTYPTDSALGAVAGLGNIAVIIVGIVLLIFIRGDVRRASPANGDVRARENH